MGYWYSFLVPVAAGMACVAALAQGPTYQLGRPASPEEVQAWDISVGPSGKELPPGRGTVQEGAAIFAQKCVVCHGPTGAEGPSLPNRWPFSEGVRRVTPLRGGEGTLDDPDPVRTIGSFWPYATTIWDYINRAMPPTQEGSLSADEVYSLTAFLLHLNGIIEENTVIDAETLPRIRMPNHDGFVPETPQRWWEPGIPSSDQPVPITEN